MVLDRQGRMGESLSDWDLCLKGLDREHPLRIGFELLRICVLAKTGDHLQAAEQMCILGDDADSDSAMCYNKACVYALMVQAVSQDQSSPALARQLNREAYLGEAIAALSLAQLKGGFTDVAAVERLRTDSDLTAIRDTPEFLAFLRGLQGP
jgi:hypothetical protein